MSLFSIWPEFGFRENPYSNAGLPGDETGDFLLTGRDREVAELQRKIGSTGTQPTVEGLAGVGKSSLVSVAGYRMFRRCIEAEEGTLFLPARRLFQASSSAQAFEDEVFREVAQTLISKVRAFDRVGLQAPDLGGLDKWLNVPQYRNAEGQAMSLGIGYGSEPNTSEGFTQTGFPDAVREQLRRCFPGPAAGAVLCVLDNLELLQTSAQARQTLEELRDTVFNLPGLRWVLCGSRGIVTHARSQRLSGVFQAPMQLGPLPRDAAIDLIRRRIEYFGTTDSYAPVPPKAFEYLYGALHNNLRDALAYAQMFADWLYGEYLAEGQDLPPREDRQGLLEAWLTQQSDEAYAVAKVQRRVWQFFDALAGRGGRCGAGEWTDYNFGTQQQMVRAVTDLVSGNLVVREVDPDNASRSLATITPVGWLVYFHRNRYELPGA